MWTVIYCQGLHQPHSQSLFLFKPEKRPWERGWVFTIEKFPQATGNAIMSLSLAHSHNNVNMYCTIDQFRFTVDCIYP